jgi:outer membrane receptor protein involved in Fe transport
MTLDRSGNTHRILSTTILGSLLALLCPANLAWAQEESTSADYRFEEIVVTAMRREQRLIDVPQSVQAFTGTELEFQGIDDLNTVLLEIPGATQGFTTTPGTAQYNFRGTGGQGQLGDMAIGFYIDDVPYYTPDNPYAPAIRFFDLEAVEVLRGPQGTLYGQGSMGGTIIVKTADPNLENFEGRARVRGWDLKSGATGYGIDGTVSVPLVEGKAALRITGGYEKTPGLAENPEFPGENNIDDGSIWDVRTKLLFQPTENLSILATYWDSNNQGDFAPTYFSNEPPTIRTGSVRAERDNRTQLASLVVDYDLSIGTITSSTSLNKYRDELLLGVGLILPPEAAFTIDLDARSESFNQELTLTSTIDDVDFILGATYTNADRETDFAQDLSLITPPISLFSVATITRTDTEQFAFFGEVSKPFMDGLLTPLVGLRYYRDERKFRDADSNNANVSEFEDVFSTFSPRFNLAIKPSEEVRVYLNVAKGFRSGNFNPQGFVGLAQLFGVDTNTANPEASLWAYEVGARFNLLGGDLVIEPAVYYNDYSDYQFAGTVGGVALVSLSLDKVESMGADLVINYATGLDGLSLGFSGNINETTAKNLDPVLVSQVAGLNEDEQLPYTPEWSYSVHATYTQPVSDTLDGFGHVALRSQGKQLSTSDEFARATTDLSLRLGVISDNWKLALFGENLTNQRRPLAVRSLTTQTRRDTRTLGLEFTVSY